MHNCLKTAQLCGHGGCFGRNKKESIILTVSFQLENLNCSIKLCRFVRNDCNACSETIMTTHLLLLGIRKKVNAGEPFFLL